MLLPCTWAWLRGTDAKGMQLSPLVWALASRERVSHFKWRHTFFWLTIWGGIRTSSTIVMSWFLYTIKEWWYKQGVLLRDEKCSITVLQEHRLRLGVIGNTVVVGYEWLLVNVPTVLDFPMYQSGVECDTTPHFHTTKQEHPQSSVYTKLSRHVQGGINLSILVLLMVHESTCPRSTTPQNFMSQKPCGRQHFMNTVQRRCYSIWYNWNNIFNTCTHTTSSPQTKHCSCKWNRCTSKSTLKNLSTSWLWWTSKCHHEQRSNKMYTLQ